MNSGNESDYIYKRDSNGDAFKFKRDSQVVTDKAGKLHEVPKGFHAVFDSKGKVNIMKHFSSARKRKNPPPRPSQDEEDSIGDDSHSAHVPVKTRFKLSQREVTRKLEQMAKKYGNKG